MSERIKIPIGAYQLRTDAMGFEALGKIHSRLAEFRNTELAIDCQRLFWMDAHLAAPFMTIVSHAIENKNKIFFHKMPDNVKLILQKNGFFENKKPDNYRTTIPVEFFSLDSGVKFSKYTKSHLMRKEMPQMSSALIGKIFEGIDELFANCALHSNSTVDIVATGQFFPRGETLAFAISDGGRGIDGSLKAADRVFRSADIAIDWAMQSTNTSRQGDVPGGLGLKVLRKFVELNKGKLLVVSNGGLWRQSGSNVEKKRLSNPFPGTSVVLEIMTNDRHVYDRESNLDPRDIW